MTSKAPERWRKVVGFEASHEVSDRGRVRTIDRMVVRSNGFPFHVRSRILAQVPNAHGYLTTGISIAGRTRRVLTHRLVLSAFVGPCPRGMEGCHNDGNPGNASLDNLRWDTKLGNYADKKRHGTDRQSTVHECRNGHPLKLPNLVASTLGKARDCLACNRSRAFARGRRIPWTRELADEYLDRIMKGNP